ncbi:unnamed protein product, partial [Callosobruchus maculatus]
SSVIFRLQFVVSASVVLVALAASVQCRHLADDLDNEVSQTAEGNMGSPVGMVGGQGGHPGGEWVKISQPPVSVITRKVGQHVELRCDAMGSPPPTIQWFKRNQRITENESFEENNLITGSPGLAKVSSRLVINYLLPRHQDIYRCVAESGGKMASAASKLIITNKEGREMNLTQLINAKILGAHHLPRVTFWASTYMDVIGNDVILPCKFVGNPKPSVVWIDPYSKVIESDGEKYSVSQDGELKIRAISWSDMGPYTCAVENSAGEDSVETFLYPMQESTK